MQSLNKNVWFSNLLDYARLKVLVIIFVILIEKARTRIIYSFVKLDFVLLLFSFNLHYHFHTLKMLSSF